MSIKKLLPFFSKLKYSSWMCSDLDESEIKAESACDLVAQFV